MGFLFVAGTVVAFLPMMGASKELHSFCDGLGVGTPLVQVQARALEQGYELLPLANAARVRATQGYVRRECEVRFDAKGVISTKFGDFD
jgi:hypothetical protein